MFFGRKSLRNRYYSISISHLRHHVCLFDLRFNVPVNSIRVRVLTRILKAGVLRIHPWKKLELKLKSWVWPRKLGVLGWIWKLNVYGHFLVLQVHAVTPTISCKVMFDYGIPRYFIFSVQGLWPPRLAFHAVQLAVMCDSETPWLSFIVMSLYF